VPCALWLWCPATLLSPILIVCFYRHRPVFDSGYESFSVEDGPHIETLLASTAVQLLAIAVSLTLCSFIEFRANRLSIHQARARARARARTHTPPPAPRFAEEADGLTVTLTLTLYAQTFKTRPTVLLVSEWVMFLCAVLFMTGLTRRTPNFLACSANDVCTCPWRVVPVYNCSAGP
jgi:hypothetical protein